MSLTRVVAWNTTVQVAGRLLGLVASIAINAMLTRHLGLAGFGQVVTAATYIAIFTVLGDAGLYLATVRRAAQDPSTRPQVLGTALWLRLVLAVALLGLGCAIVWFIPADRFATWSPTLRIAVLVCAVNAFFTLQSQLIIAVFRLHMRMDLAVIGEIAARLVTLGAVAATIATGGGVVAACWALTSGTVFNFIYGMWVTRRFERFRPQLERALARAMLSESVALTMVTVLGLIHFKADTLILSVLRSPAEVGIYGVAYKLHEVLITFPGLFVGLVFPVFARFTGTDEERLQQVFQRTFDVLCLASIGAALLVFVGAPAFAAVLGAPQAAAPMRVLAFALPAVFINLGLTHLLLAEGRQRWLVRLYIALVIANVGSNWIAIRLWSYQGAAAVTVATETLALGILSVYWFGRRRWRLGIRVLWAVPLALALGWGGTFVAAALQLERATGASRVFTLAAVGLAVGLAYAGGVLGFRLLPATTVRALWKRDRSATP